MAIKLPMARAEREANSLADGLQLSRIARIPAGFEQVDMRRPGSLGNPFSVTANGRLIESWRGTLCAAFRSALTAALAEQNTSLLAIAATHGLPAAAVVEPYASRTWAAYSADVRVELLALHSRLRIGEWLALACACHPKECHVRSIIDALVGELSISA